MPCYGYIIIQNSELVNILIRYFELSSYVPIKPHFNYATLLYKDKKITPHEGAVWRVAVLGVKAKNWGDAIAPPVQNKYLFLMISIL